MSGTKIRKLTIIEKNTNNDSDNAIVYIDNWTVIYEDGKSFEVGRSYDDKRAYKESFTCISKLPDNIGNGKILCFMDASNVSVYINGKLRKEFDVKKDVAIPGGILKEVYIQVPLSSEDSGARIKIVRGTTDRNPMVVSDTFISSSQGIYSYMVNKYGVVFVFSVVLFIVSLMAVVVGVIMRLWMRQHIDMLYGALGYLL